MRYDDFPTSSVRNIYSPDTVTPASWSSTTSPS